ncbi:MAG: dihydroneopterin aldolase [Candidatus Dormibacteria bacterium]
MPDVGPDRLQLAGLRFFGHHGVSAAERHSGGEYTVDLLLETDTTRAAASDRLEDAVDYVQLCQVVQTIVESREFHLLESLAAALAAGLLAIPGVARVRIRVTKPPRLPCQTEGFAVEISRPV